MNWRRQAKLRKQAQNLLLCLPPGSIIPVGSVIYVLDASGLHEVGRIDDGRTLEGPRRPD